MNGKGAHCELSQQCTCTENLKWILDKQLKVLSRTSLSPAAWERGYSVSTLDVMQVDIDGAYREAVIAA